MRRLACLLALCAGIGCLPWAGGLPFKTTTPPGFVELSNQQPAYDYRAVTADGVVLAITAIKNDPRGDLAFWTQAISNRMRIAGGYAELGRQPVRCRSVEGLQFRFGHDEGREPHLYFLTLFITDARIFLLEVGGTRTLVERHTKDIDAWHRGFEPG